MAQRKNAARELAEFQHEERFHRREWTVQRAGWLLLALLIVSGLLGLLGHGPLAHRQLAIGEAVLEMDRFARRNAAQEWKIQPAANADASQLIVRIETALLAAYEISRIVPEPASQRIEGRNVVMLFDGADAQGDIVFHVEAQQFGSSAGEIQVGTAPPAHVSQFVYP